MPFEPRDPGYRKRVRDSFARQAAMQTLGMTIARLDPGEVELSMPYERALTQQHGFIHGGVVAAGLDTACGYAAFSLMSADAAVLTVEFKTNFLAPAKGQRFVFRAQVIKAGRTITVCDAQALALGEGAERVIATMTATLMAVYERPGIRQ